jgi:hypothetical protein
MDGSDGVAPIHLLESDLRGGVHLFSGKLRLAKNQERAIVKQLAVGGGDQFLRIAASLPFEAASETVGIGLQRAALGGDSALTILDSTLPGSRTMSF